MLEQITLKMMLHLIPLFLVMEGVIREVHSSVQIVISAIKIIPGIKDYKAYNKIILDVNFQLNKVITFKFICTYKPLNIGGQLNVALYANNDGGLHLNTEGSRRLKHFFLRVISH